MAVTSVEIQPGSRTCSIDRNYAKRYARAYVVETDDPTTGVIAVRTAAGLPSLGSAFVDTDGTVDYGAYCEGAEVTEEGVENGGYQWLVRVTWGPLDTSLFGPDPLLWPLRVSFGGDQYERVVWFDRNGDPIRNSATDPFGEPIVVDDSRPTFVVTRNELVATFDQTLASLMSDAINDAAWNGFAAGTVKCGIIVSGDEQYDPTNNVWYYSVKYPFAVKRDGWVKEILDSGFAELDGSSPPKPKPILNNGNPITEPAPLDGSGHRLATTGTPVTLTFDVYDTADYSIFNMDLNVRLGL